MQKRFWRCTCGNINRGDGDCSACEYNMLSFVNENRKEQYFEEKECSECGLTNDAEAELCAGCANELPMTERKTKEEDTYVEDGLEEQFHNYRRQSPRCYGMIFKNQKELPHENDLFRRRHSKTKTAMEVYLESQQNFFQEAFQGIQVGDCSANLSSRSVSPRPVQSPVRRASGYREIPRKPNPKTHTSGIGIKQAIHRPRSCEQRKFSSSDQNKQFFESLEQPLDAGFLFDCIRNADVGSPGGRVSGCRLETGGRVSGCRLETPMEQMVNSPEVLTEQEAHGSQSTQGQICSSINHTEQLRLAAEQQPMDAEPKYDFPRDAGVGSPARREYGYGDIHGRQEMSSPGNVRDMASEQEHFMSQNPECHSLYQSDQAKLQMVHVESQYDLINDAEGGAPVERASGYREELLGGQEVHRPEHVRDIVSDQEHHKSQSAQRHITPSTDKKKQLRTEPMYDFIREEIISSMEETGKPSTDQQNDIAVIVQGPSSTTDKNIVTKAHRTWACHCGNVSLIGKDCLTCQENKVKGPRKPEKSNNSCIQEPERGIYAFNCGNVNLIGNDCLVCCETKPQKVKEEEKPRSACIHGTENRTREATFMICKNCGKLIKTYDDMCYHCRCGSFVQDHIPAEQEQKQDRKEEATYNECKNCGKLIKRTDDICFYCRCGSFVPDLIPAEQEQEQESRQEQNLALLPRTWSSFVKTINEERKIRNEIDQSENYPGVFKQVESFFGFGKSRKEENGAVFCDNDGFPCLHCKYRNPPNANICDMCKIQIHEAASGETSLKPPDNIIISEGVTISGEDFVKYLKAGEEHGFHQGQMIWALRNRGAEDPIRFLRRWRDDRVGREYETKAAQAAAYQATAYQHQHGPVLNYPLGTPIIVYPHYEFGTIPKEMGL